VVTLVTIVLLVGGIRWAAASDPAIAGSVVTGLVVAVFLYGLGSNRRFQPRPWHTAWTVIGAGFAGVAGAAVLELLHLGGDPAGLGAPMVVSTVGGVLALVGLVWLIHQRQAARAAESLAEATVASLALAFVVLALIVVPTRGWRPAHDLPAIAAPLLDLILLWLAASLMSLTDRHPLGYRFLLAGLACLFVANSAAAASAFSGPARSSTFSGTVAVLGICLWGASVVHPSRRVPFDPVPQSSRRPSGLKVAMLVAVALVVPGVLSVQSALGIPSRNPALIVGSTLLPLLLLLYLLHQVFTHADAEYKAQHDPLTGACNRVLFEERIRIAVGQAERTGTSVAVMFLDLDRFKDINDSLGHAIGNELLKSVVKRLQGALREQDTLARFGGDEFTFLVSDCGAKDARTATLAERILDRFGDPFNVGGRQLTVQASIGVAVYPHDGEDAETLLKHADTAMYQAKAAGRNTFEIFDTAMSARARLRFALEDSLRTAVERARLAVHYQPKLDMASGGIAGVEALARWQHPRLGFIPPWAFIPLAEETSLVATLGEWVLEIACRQVQRWQDQGLPAVPVAVNLSPRQFTHHSVVDVVAKVLARTGLDPRLLELEVTESVLMDHMSAAAASLSELRTMGVRCSIDDFGTGYNALTYLAEIPVDAIKIDRSFIHRIDGEASGAPIVGAVIALAHGLGLTVVAEGVETDAQLRFLDAHHCDQVQGFRFSRPVPADEFAELVRHPESMFTGWRDEVVVDTGPASVVSPARLEALLDSVLQERRWPSELDTEAIETVLAALAHDDKTIRTPRALRARLHRAAFGGQPELVPVPGGSAEGSLAPVERLATRVFQVTDGEGIDEDLGAPQRSTG
jgi:diguanylate cyclase (GGDEF)-like protein